ncbi:MAG: phosphoribosylformylglycinamidine synthase subunit PurS [Saprospiraceae bacterium]|nr:phosphoribosylformylglycinamidine synthase subunit PurS [Saprospiraceae bacterium]
MKFIAEIDVMPHKELLDPQGKTVGKHMDHIGIEGVKDVRIGKHIQMVLDCVDEAKAKEEVEKACQKILTNPIMESYTYVLTLQ